MTSFELDKFIFTVLSRLLYPIIACGRMYGSRDTRNWNVGSVNMLVYSKVYC